MALKVLGEIKKERPELEIEMVDVVSSPLRAWKDGIRMIPAMKAGEKKLSAILLDKKTISAFLDTI